MRGMLMLGLIALLGRAGAAAQGDPAPRGSLSAGMGVEYVSLGDVTTIINATVAPAQVVPRFKSEVEFFGACTFPLARLWLLKFEYAYAIASFNVQGAYAPASFGVTCHMPSLILQYMLLDRGVYNVRAGAGGGWHFGYLSEKYFSINDTFSGSGPGFVMEIEANTAFGDHLFAYLGANLRWESIGTLLDPSGQSPGVASGGSNAALHAYGAGVRLGAAYLF